jgi:protein-L-isoaspartate(D-aspartate) O-methyltransferase
VAFDLNSLKRKELVEKLFKSGIKDKEVLRAIGKVKREFFINEELRKFAYDNIALPINSRQTISQPYTVAFMTQLLSVSPGDKVLEIGTGSGYQAAVLKELGAEVYSIERIKDLYQKANVNLKNLGYNVNLKLDDGTKGWEEFAPFEGIIVTAGSPKIPTPLLDQLQINGRMVIPLGDKKSQQIALVKKVKNDDGEVKHLIKKFSDFKFVPLIGEEGWEEVD